MSEQPQEYISKLVLTALFNRKFVKDKNIPNILYLDTYGLNSLITLYRLSNEKTWFQKKQVSFDFVEFINFFHYHIAGSGFFPIPFHFGPNFAVNTA